MGGAGSREEEMPSDSNILWIITGRFRCGGNTRAVGTHKRTEAPRAAYRWAPPWPAQGGRTTREGLEPPSQTRRWTAQRSCDATRVADAIGSCEILFSWAEDLMSPCRNLQSRIWITCYQSECGRLGYVPRLRVREHSTPSNVRVERSRSAHPLTLCQRWVKTPLVAADPALA